MSKTKKDIILLNDSKEKEENLSKVIDEAALELSVILPNLIEYPHVHTLEDLFNLMKYPINHATDFVLAEAIKELLPYPEIEEPSEKEEVTDSLNALYVEIPVDGLYTRFNKNEKYKKVKKICFLRQSKYKPGENDALNLLPILGEELSDIKEATSENGSAPLLVSIDYIKNAKEFDSIKRKLKLGKRTTDSFVVGNKVYSVTLGILGEHGGLKSYQNLVGKKRSTL